MPEVANGHVLFKDDIEFGYWDWTHRSFDSGKKPFNAVRVTLRRSIEIGNAAPTFFHHLFGAQDAEVTTQSLAGIVVPLIEHIGDPSMLPEAEQKKIAEMIEDVEETIGGMRATAMSAMRTVVARAASRRIASRSRPLPSARVAPRSSRRARKSRAQHTEQ